MQNEFVEIFSKFLPVAVRILQLKSIPDFEFTDYLHHDEQPTFGMYVNDTQTLHVALAGRHPNDILRTIAHELTHHKQNLADELDHQSGDTGSPEENEAHELAGVIMRYFNKMHRHYFHSRPLEP